MSLHRFRRFWRATLVFASVLVAGSQAARACSICRCGDPTFNALGSNIYSSGDFHLAIDWDRFEKSQVVVYDGES